jgi:beta-lactamase class A
VALAGGAAMQHSATALADPGIEDRLGELERANDAIIGVHAVELDTGRTISYRDDELFAICSTFKTYAAAAVLQKVQLSQLRLDDEVPVDPAELVDNSAVTQTHAGGTLPLRELCRAALQQSDNTAGNLLLRAIGGPPAITEFARQLGDEATRLDRWETELNSAVPGDPRDTSTPHMIGRGYKVLLTTNVLARPQRQQLELWMRENVTSAMRPGLPDGWTCADKTGSGDYGSTNDIGVVYGPGGRRVMLSIMTRSAAPDPTAPNLRPLITEIARFAVPYMLQ